MFEHLLARLRKRRQGIGYFGLTLYGVVWLVRKLSAGMIDVDYRYILIQEVPAQPLLKGRGLRGHEIRVLEGAALALEDQRDRNGAFSREPRDEVRFLRRVERGDVCLAAMNGARVEGVLWLSFGIFDESDVKANFVVDPTRGMAWDSNLYIVEDARGGFLFAALWDAANALLRSKNYRMVATQTSAFNGASLQAHARMGARRVAKIVYILIGRWQMTFTTLRPRFAFLGPSSEAPVYPIPVPDELARDPSM